MLIVTREEERGEDSERAYERQTADVLIELALHPLKEAGPAEESSRSQDQTRAASKGRAPGSLVGRKVTERFRWS